MRKIIRISVSFIIVFTMLLTCNGVLVNADNEDTVSYQLVDNSQSAEITINPETIDNLEVENVNVSNSKGIVKEFTKSDSYQLTVSENDTYDIVVTYNDTDKTTKSYELKITDIKTNEESKTTENVKEEKTIESAKETTFTVKYHLNNATNNNSLATGAYFSSNNSQDLEVSNIASGTELKNAGYTYGTPSNASGYSNSGTIVNSNALLLCWRDASDTIYSTLDTVTTDLDLYAYWASDANKDGVMDQAVQDYVINTTIGGTLDGEITTKTGATQHKTTDVNGKTVYNISYNLFVATGSTLMSQMVPLMVGTSDYRNSDTYANLLKNKTGLIINSCNQPRTLSNAISSSMPTIIPDRGKKVVGFSTDSKVLTATDCLTYEPTSALQTYTATYGDIAKVKITYDLNDADAKFASNQKNILEVDAYVGEKLSQAGIVYGTPDGTKGAYKTTGDIVNNDKMLILWEDEEGNPVNIETVITQSMTLHAEWVTDQDNDGYPDGSIQKYELKTNEYGRFTKDPEMKKGGSFTTRYDPSDTSHVYPIYEIEYNEMINIGYDTTSFAQLIVMMKALRPNINYTSKIDTILKKVESARDSDKPLEKAFTTPPVHSGLSINPLIDWESDGNNLDDSTYLTYVPTSDDQKYIANYAELEKCKVTYHLGDKGTLATNGVHDYTSNTYVGIEYRYTDYLVGFANVTPRFSTTGDIVNDSQILIAWVDSSGKLVAPSDVTDGNIDLYARWVSDDNLDQSADELNHNFQLDTSTHGSFTDSITSKQQVINKELTATPSMKLQDISTISTQDKVTNILVDNFAYTGARKDLPASILQLINLRTTPLYETIIIKAEQLVLDGMNGNCPLGDAINGLPELNVDNGYVFKYWQDEDGNKYTNEQLLAIKQVKTTQKYTAIYEPISYDITYELNGGTNSSANPKGYNIESDDIDYANPTKKGYDFAGWYLDSDFQTKVEKTTTGSSGDITLYAKWTVRNDTPYSVKYYVDNGQGGYNLHKEENLIGTTESTVTATPINIAKYTYDSGNDKEVLSSEVNGNGSTELKLYYTLNKTYNNIDFDLNGHGNDKISSQVIENNKTLTKPKDPIDNGYGFYGWFTDKDCLHPYNFDEPVTKSMTLYAGWIDSASINMGSYKINYYKIKKNGKYKLYKTTTNKNIPYGTHVNAAIISIDGYHLNSSVNNTSLSGYVLPNADLVLNLYYDKNEIAVSKAASTGDNVNITTYVTLLLGSILVILKKKYAK